MKRIQYYEGDVFQLGQKMRRVVAVVNDKRGRQLVVYSTGGNKNRRCLLRAFRKFESAGKMIHAGRARPG